MQRGATPVERDGSGRWTRWGLAGAMLAALVVTAACGGEGEVAADVAADVEPAASGAETAAAAPAPAATDAAAQAVADGVGVATKPAPKRTSLDGGPFPAGDLRDAYFHWKDETVTVVGYPSQFRSPGRWQSRTVLGSEPVEKAPGLLECELSEVPEGKIASDSPVVLRGTFTHRYLAVRDGEPPRIRMKDCEVVSTGGEMPTDGDPWTLGAEPIPVEALHDAVFGWQGKPVQVVGYYHGSGYSSATDKTRVNLKQGSGGKPAVGCEMAGEVPAPESMIEQREGVVVEGTLGEPGWDNLTLDDCRILNRS